MRRAALPLALSALWLSGSHAHTRTHTPTPTPAPFRPVARFTSPTYAPPLLRSVNNIQFVLLALMLFWPRRLIEAFLAPCHDCTDFHLTLATQVPSLRLAASLAAEGGDGAVVGIAR